MKSGVNKDLNDEPRSPLAVSARILFQKALQAADEKRAATLQLAKDGALTQLEAGLDKSFQNKNRNDANAIAAAIRSLKERAIIDEAGLPAADKVREEYKEAIRTAGKQFDAQVSPAKLQYLVALEHASDAAFEGKDLEEVNRIAAVLERLTAEMASEVARVENSKAAYFQNSMGMSFKPLTGGPAGDFSIGVHEVTQAHYENVMGMNPSNFKGPNHPVEQVRLEDAAEFCKKLSMITAEIDAGRVYRLPTKTEWIYACRAGMTTAYSFGDDDEDIGKYAWCKDNSGGATHAVGEKLPNDWGLYDMHGNVWEWCYDAAGKRPERCGGSWHNEAVHSKSANHHRVFPSCPFNSCGFRIVLSSGK